MQQKEYYLVKEPVLSFGFISLSFMTGFDLPSQQLSHWGWGNSELLTLHSC